MKFDPWSLKMRDGFPLLAIKHCRQAIKASVVKSESSLRCTAFPESTHTYNLNRVGMFSYIPMLREDRTCVVNSSSIEN